MRHSEQPSQRAASTSSLGMAEPMYWRMRNMPRAPAAPGIHRARCLSIQPRAFMIMNVGIIPRKGG